MRKRIVSILLTCGVLLSLFTGITPKASAVTMKAASTSDVISMLASWKGKLNGKYWNYYERDTWNSRQSQVEANLKAVVDNGTINAASATNAQLGVTTTACSGSLYPYGCESNYFSGGWQCYGFAWFIEYALFQSTYQFNSSDWNVYGGNSLSNISLQPGDLVRVNNHSIVVGDVSGGVLNCVECWGGSGCKISWSPGFNWSQYTTPSSMLAACKNNGGTVYRYKGIDGASLNTYYLDINGLLDGDNVSNIDGYGTVDVYINGSLDANDVSDYYKKWPAGTTYELKDIKANTGYVYDGLADGSISGYISSSNVGVRLIYNTEKPSGRITLSDTYLDLSFGETKTVYPAISGNLPSDWYVCYYITNSYSASVVTCQWQPWDGTYFPLSITGEAEGSSLVRIAVLEHTNDTILAEAYVTVRVTRPKYDYGDFYAYIVHEDSGMRVVNQIEPHGRDVGLRSEGVYWDTNYLWHFEALGSGFYRIVNEYDGRILTASLNETTSLGGKVVYLADEYYFQDSTQTWFITSNSSGVHLVSLETGLVLDLYNADQTEGNYFHLWSDNGTNAQNFYLEFVSSYQGLQPIKAPNVYTWTSGSNVTVLWAESPLTSSTWDYRSYHVVIEKDNEIVLDTYTEERSVEGDWMVGTYYVTVTAENWCYSGERSGARAIGTGSFSVTPLQIIFDACGGTVGITTKYVEYNQPYGELPVAYRDGFIFLGWFDSEGTQITSDSIVPFSVDSTASKTLYAHWTSNCEVVGHSYVNTLIAPSCTAQGYTTYTCSRCGDSYKDTYTAALGHNYVDGVCTRCGEADPDFVTDAKLTVSGKPLTAAPGTTITVPVLISGGEPFAGFTLSVNSSDGLTLKKIEKGALLQTADGMFTPNVAQKVVNWTSSTNTVGEGELLLLTFDVSASAADGSRQTISLCLKDNKVSNFADADERPVGVKFEDIAVTVQSVRPGDVNGDGEIDTIDAIRLAKYLVDLVELSDAQLRAADVTGDNDVTATDAIRLAKYLVGLINTLDKSPARAAQRAAGDEEIAVVEAEIAVGEAAAKPGETVIVPVSISGNPGFAGFTLTVAGAEGLTLTNIEKGELLANADGMFTKNVAQSRVNWTSSENITGDGTLLMLSFALDSDAADGTYAISVELKDGKQSNFANAEEAIVAVTFSAGKITVGEAHEHQYTAVVTPPTCTEQGYTTYTCACGDSYVADEVAATGHNYVDGVCTVCGAVDPNYKPDDPQPIDNPFEDVKDSDWFKDAVLWAVSQKPAITNGTDATHFSPTKTCTRAEVVQFLWNAAGQPAVDAASNPFSDVKANDWYYKAVMWAVSNGITSGTDATHFAPGKKCTRAEVVAFLRNASTDKEVKTTTNPFTDVKASDWYYNSVLWAVERGITSGTTPTTFAPTKTCTRAEVVQFLYKAS